MKRRSSVDEVDTAQERQEGQGLKWRRCLLGDPCAVLDEEGTVMGLDAQEAGGSRVHMEGTVTGQRNCHRSKEKEQCIGHQRVGHEEEEQCQ